MKGLTSKASRFFKEGPSADEQAANADNKGPSGSDFDAGIQPTLNKKPSLFSLKKAPKGRASPPPPPLPQIPVDLQTNVGPVPSPPACPTASTAASVVLPAGYRWAEEQVARTELDDNHPAYRLDAFSKTHFVGKAPSAALPAKKSSGDVQGEDVEEAGERRSESLGEPAGVKGKGKVADEGVVVEAKKTHSFQTLRTRGSRFFRSASASTSDSIAEDEPSTHRNPFSKARTLFSAINSSTRPPMTISRPVLTAQPSADTPSPTFAATIPFTKRPGPPPPRPNRPASLDQDTIDLMRSSGTRMVMPRSPHTSSPSSPSTAHSLVSRSSADARRGPPSGPSSPSTTPYHSSKSFSLDARASGRLSESSFMPRPRNSSILGGRFASNEVDAEEREDAKVEQFEKSVNGRWVMERRVSGSKGGMKGVLWKDADGGFQFVADV